MFIKSTGGTSQLLARARRGVGIKLIALAALLLPLSVALSTTWAAPAARPASPAAPTFTVNSVSDLVAAAPLDNGPCETVPGNGVCTLRAAIMKANHFPGGGATIVFASHAAGTTYVLAIPQSGPDDETTGDLNITAAVTIVGNGAGITIIDGNGSITNDRVFSIDTGVAVTMTGVTIQHGGPFPSDGAGLLNDGQLTLDHSAVLSNTVFAGVPAYGGGIYNEGTLTVSDSLIRGNGIGSNNLSGGGISGFVGSIALINTTIAGNHAQVDGGGIDHADGTLNVYSSTISGNNANNNGGGVNSSHPNASFVNTSIISNTAGNGGGLANIGCSMALVNSTVSGNNANDNGGGIWNSVGCVSGGGSMFNVTIAENQADADFNGSGTGGGIYNEDKVQLQNSLVADNGATLFDFEVHHYLPSPDDCHGTLTSLDYNLISFMTIDCTLTGGTQDQTNVSAHLDFLHNNGGPTLTNALLLGSPAIDAGNPGGCDDPFGATLATDQRGATRPVNGGSALRCDIGAYEYGAKIPQTIAFSPLANKIFGDPSFSVSATASSGLTVTFTAAGQCNVAGNMVTLTNTGSCSITAHQAGDANYAAAPDAPQSFAISASGSKVYLPLIVK